MEQTIGLVVNAAGGTGVLHRLTGVIAQHDGNITSVEILENRPEQARTYFDKPAGRPAGRENSAAATDGC